MSSEIKEVWINDILSGQHVYCEETHTRIFLRIINSAKKSHIESFFISDNCIIRVIDDKNNILFMIGNCTLNSWKSIDEKVYGVVHLIFYKKTIIPANEPLNFNWKEE